MNADERGFGPQMEPQIGTDERGCGARINADVADLGHRLVQMDADGGAD